MRQETLKLFAETHPGPAISGRALHYRLFSLIVPMMLGLVALIPGAWAQDMVLGYAGAMGGTGFFDVGHGIAIDNADNVYTTGYFEGTMDFDPGVGAFNLTSAGDEDAFVCKLDASGTFQWAVAIGGAGDNRSYEIAVDGEGGVYTTGYFTGTADFDPGPGVYSLTSAGFHDAFVCKLDASGLFQWAVTVGGANNDACYGIAVDGAGNVYSTGHFFGTLDFDPGPGVFNLTSLGGTTGFVWKLDGAGVFQWAGAIGRSVTSVAVDGAGNVYSAGRFSNTSDFDPSPGVFNLTSAGSLDAFVCKLDGLGAFQWVGAMGGSDFDMSYAVVVDDAGNVYSTGFFRGTADFDPGPGVFNLTSAGGSDAFICKLNASGVFQWAASIGGTDHDRGYGIVVDGAGGVYATGTFLGTVDFDPGPGVFNLTDVGTHDAFVWKLDEAGAFQWAGSMGGAGYDSGSGITVDSVGNVFSTGQFVGTGDFDPGPDVLNLSSTGGYDVFIVKLEPKSLPVANGDIGATNADQLLSTLTSPASTSVLANDTDSNTMDTLTVTAHDATSVLGAAVLVNPDGTFVYDPTAVPVLQALAAGDSVVDSFTYDVSDGTDTVVGTVTITVYGKGTTLPATTLWGVCLLCLVLLGAGVRVRCVSQRSAGLD